MSLSEVSATSPNEPQEESDSLLVHDHLEGGAVRGDKNAESTSPSGCNDFLIVIIHCASIITIDFGESYDDVPKSKRTLGFTSAVFLISNRIIGVGIFATPSIILQSAGSVGMALRMWAIGAVVVATGTAVYLDLETELPISGGEKFYLRFRYRHPKHSTFEGYESCDREILSGSDKTEN